MVSFAIASPNSPTGPNLKFPITSHQAYSEGMNAENLPPVLPTLKPVRLERYEEPPRPPRPFWLHPASAGLILAVDWLFFGAEIITLEVALVFACFSAFIITTVGVFWIQRSKSHDSLGAAIIKALFAGLVAGLPTSIGGTLLGTLVLVLAGRASWSQRK